MQSQTFIRRVMPLCLVAALVVALAAACGDDSTSKATATPGGGTTATTSGTTGPAGSTATAGSSATAAPATATPVATAPIADQIGAGQTLISYYTALNSQNYPAAYAMWADNGAASNQTEAQFAQGYGNTVRIQAQFENAVPSSDGVAVAATILSVVNTPATPTPGQVVETYSGVYHLKQQGGTWKITGGDIQRGPDATKAPADVVDSTTALLSYYKALNDQQYARAFTYWSNEGEANGSSFSDFANGYTNTKSIAAHLGSPVLGGAAGSVYATVPSVIVSTMKDGSQQTFCGNYTMRQINVRPFELLGWHIDSAAITQVSGPAPDATAIQHMLTNNCAAT
ncbi:MAG TPA: hypothetical protein VN697_14440 [Tepidiformaceae bacterium]|nr:hypothetical protein [Tepidiformaceae bacterium]